MSHLKYGRNLKGHQKNLKIIAHIALRSLSLKTLLLIKANADKPNGKGLRVELFVFKTSFVDPEWFIPDPDPATIF